MATIKPAAAVVRIQPILIHVILIFALTLTESKVDSSEFFTFQLNEINGKPLHFERFRGKTTLLVNTASQCGFTELQMNSLKRMYDILSYGQVFNIVAFPCNDFGEQEPWDNEEIEEYYRRHFKVEFIITEKGSIKDSPVWKWIEKSTATTELPQWNFHKYLINGNGTVIGNWPGEISVEDIFQEVQNAIKSGVSGIMQGPQIPYEQSESHSEVPLKEEL